MLFNSDLFLFAFLPVIYVGFIVSARFSSSAASLLLVVGSCIFYAHWRFDFLPLLLGSAAANYLCGQGIARLSSVRPHAARALLGAGVAGNLALLGYYKYADFLAGAVGFEGIFSGILLPIGISFYTFTQTAYLVDVHDEPSKVVSDPIRYLLFVTFFPHLVAGPILHHRDMMPQFAFDARGDQRLQDFVVGSALFIMGLFKKVILADSVQPYTALAFTSEPISTVSAWAGALAFSLQLYFDFSGYSDMALGLARLFGVRFPLNFDSPYKAESIIEFWRRWHMTLSRFLRDYLYIPLGGNRSGLGHLPNLMITMVLGGLWHGAGWTFLAWGALHGGYLIVNHMWRRLRARFPEIFAARPGSAVVGRLLTFVCVVVGWVFFRADSMEQAVRVVHAMAGHGTGAALACPAGAGSATVYACWAGMPTAFWWIAGLLAIAWLLPNSQQIMSRWNPALSPIRPAGPIARALSFYPGFLWAVALGAMLASALVWLHADSVFLYYQF
ncbi:MBOAT family protein [Roseomonas hellenica]|uniref:Probable alginate O-acetylase AlgI n=1 Tax=Plastoroseomonas hellenica TaxID=2687306 RepID=A0ABS5F807_9PROT|nr:MBOAT family protein [Plastoroseomonas hellenica]MBR0668265.1 MBOAT family protein [Plastoroseomonas hellenica]